MRTFWNTIFGLNIQRSIWIEQEELGIEKVLEVKGVRYYVTIPHDIKRDVVLRLRGLGKTKNDKTGDLLLHIWLNKGDDIRKNLWISEKDARNGTEKRLLLDEKKIVLVIPPKSYNGLTIRLKGLGKPLNFNWNAPFLRRISGNALIKLCVYQDCITPRYGSFDMLSTENMALEGWVYRKFDDIIHKMGKPSFLVSPIGAEKVVNLFNADGWRAIFAALVSHLGLTRLNIKLTKSDTISKPGECQKTIVFKNNIPDFTTYMITINERFLDSPFSTAAIMAHELCHVIYSESHLDELKPIGYQTLVNNTSLEEERTVDLLVFMFKIGDFQLRVARDERLTLGYFDQEIFERIQVYVTKKLNSFVIG